MSAVKVLSTFGVTIACVVCAGMWHFIQFDVMTCALTVFAILQ